MEAAGKERDDIASGKTTDTFRSANESQRQSRNVPPETDSKPKEMKTMAEIDIVEKRTVLKHIRCMHCGEITGEVAMEIYEKTGVTRDDRVQG